MCCINPLDLKFKDLRLDIRPRTGGIVVLNSLNARDSFSRDVSSAIDVGILPVN